MPYENIPAFVTGFQVAAILTARAASRAGLETDVPERFAHLAGDSL